MIPEALRKKEPIKENEPKVWSDKILMFKITEKELYKLSVENDSCVECFVNELRKYEVEPERESKQYASIEEARNAVGGVIETK